MVVKVKPWLFVQLEYHVVVGIGHECYFFTVVPLVMLFSVTAASGFDGILMLQIDY